jgi:DNA modification methylase
VVQFISSTSSIANTSSFTSNDISLISEDWSFANLTSAHTLWGPHGYHRYPAKFIPQLVRRIIDTYSTIDDRVGDPFLGSATTGIEALRARRYFYGSDIHPVAILISHAKCNVIEPQILSKAWKKLERCISILPRIERRTLNQEEIGYIKSISIARASAEERLTYWFPVYHRNALSLLLESIQNLPEEKVRIFFLCAFSNILRHCSIWLSGSTKPQKDLRKILSDPVEEFSKQVQSMLKRNTLYWEDLHSWASSSEDIERRMNILLKDVRHLALPNETLDLLVTSPPYATCYEYSEMHQLTQLWFERYHIFPTSHESDSYIGSKVISRRPLTIKPKSDSTGSSCADEALQRLQNLAVGNIASSVNQEVRVLRYYFQDMYDALNECTRVVVMHKYLVLIVGDSYRRGVIIPTSDALSEMAEHIGLTLKQKVVRRVPGRVLVPTRDKKTGRFSSIAQSDTRVYPEEDILVFQRRF